MGVLKMKPGAKARKGVEAAQHDSTGSLTHMRGMSPSIGGPLSPFYSTGPALSLL